MPLPLKYFFCIYRQPYHSDSLYTILCISRRIAEFVSISDDQAAINLLNSEKSEVSAKHVDIRFKFVCHYAQAKVVQPSIFKSDDMIANLLTKSLPAPRILVLRGLCKLKSIQDEVEE